MTAVVVAGLGMAAELQAVVVVGVYLVVVVVDRVVVVLRTVAVDRRNVVRLAAVA